MLISVLGIHNSYCQTYSGTNSFVAGDNMIDLTGNRFLYSGESNFVFQFSTVDPLPTGFTLIDTYEDNGTEKSTQITFSDGDNTININQSENALVGDVTYNETSSKYEITVNSLTFMNEFASTFTSDSKIEGVFTLNLSFQYTNPVRSSNTVYLRLRKIHGHSAPEITLHDGDPANSATVSMSEVVFNDSDFDWYSYDLSGTSYTHIVYGAGGTPLAINNTAINYFKVNSSGTLEALLTPPYDNEENVKFHIEADEVGFRPTLIIDNRSPEITMTSQPPSSDQESVEYQFELVGLDFTGLLEEDNEYFLEFYTDYNKDFLLKRIKLDNENVTSINSKYTFPFVANDTPTEFFNGNNVLFMKLLVEDVFNNEATFEGITYITQPDFFISMDETIKEKEVINGTTLEFYHNLLNSNINEDESTATCTINGTSSTATISFSEATASTFEVNIPSNIAEGTSIELAVTLKTNTNETATYSHTVIYDNLAPRYDSNNDAHEGIVDSWIDLSQSTVFKYTVTENDLDLEKTELTIGDKQIKVSSSSKDNDDYELRFILDEASFITSESGDITVGPLKLVDKAGNQTEGLSSTYSYNKFSSITFGDVVYKVDNEVVSSVKHNDNLSLTIPIESSGVMVGDEIAVQFYGVNGTPNITGETIISGEQEGEYELSFNVNIQNTVFYNNIPIKFDVSITNKSKITKRSELIEGPVANLPSSLTISRKNTDQEYVNNNFEILFEHTQTNNTQIDQTRSFAVLKRKLNNGSFLDVTLGENDGLEFQENSDFKFVTSNLNTPSEGDELRLDINLYESGGTGNQAFHSSTLIYDNTAPTYSSFVHEELNSTGNGGNTKYWIDLSKSTIFEFTVTDAHLDIDESKLFVGTDSLPVLSYTEVEDDTYKLRYDIGEVLSGNTGSRSITSLRLKDKAGNTTTNTGVSDTTYYYEKQLDLPLTSSDVLYYSVGQGNQETSIENNIGEDSIRVLIPYSTTGNVDSVKVKVLNASAGEFYIPNNQISTTNRAGIKYIVFDVNVTPDTFFSNRLFAFEVSLRNSSYLHFSSGRIEEKMIEFETSSGVQVTRVGPSPMYVGSNSKVVFEHNIESATLDTLASKAELFSTSDNTLLVELNDNFTIENHDNRFEVFIQSLDDEGVSTGDTLTLKVTLKVDGNDVIHESEVIYDNTPPIKNSDTEPNINEIVFSDSTSYWFNLNEQLIFSYNITESILDINESKLIVDGESIAATDYHLNATNNYNLDFDLGEVLKNNFDSLTIDSLILTDLAGNTSIITDISKKYFYERNVDLPLTTSSINYYSIAGVDSTLIENGIIEEGIVRVKVPYNSEGIDNISEVNLLGTIETVTATNIKTEESEGNKYISFDVNVTPTKFIHNRLFAFEIKLSNNSLLEFSSGRIEGPVLKFPSSFYITKNDPTINLIKASSKIEFSHNKENHNGIDKVRSFVKIENEDGNEVIGATLNFDGYSDNNFSLDIRSDSLQYAEGNEVPEGTKLTFEITLYESGGLGQVAFLSTVFEYDNQSPRFLSIATFDGISLYSEEDWINLSNETYLNFVAEDNNLKVSECLLTLSNGITLTAISDERGTLKFELPKSYLESSNTNVNISLLRLRDVLGNESFKTIRKVDANGSLVPYPLYYEYSSKINIAANIKYNNSILNVSDVLDGGTNVNIEVPYTSSDLTDVKIRFLGTKGTPPEINVTSFTDDETGKYFNFSFNLSENYFNNNQNLKYEIIATNLSNETKSHVVTGPIIQFPSNFYISQPITDVKYIKTGTSLNFQHSKLNRDLNKGSSKVDLKIDGTVTDITDQLTFNANNLNTFNVIVPDLSDITEGQIVEINITLYESGGSGEIARQTFSYICDNTAPQYVSTYFNDFNNIGTLESPNYWMDLTAPILFKFNVTDLDLDVSNCQLHLSSGVSLQAKSYENDILSFELPKTDLLNNSGNVAFTKLDLYDRVGNHNEKNYDENSPSPIFNYEKEGNISIKSVEYKDASQALITSGGVLDVGQYSIKVKYNSAAFDKASIRFLNTKKPYEISNGLSYNKGEKYFTFNINVTEEYFFNNSKVEFEVQFENHSSVLKTIKVNDNLTAQFSVDFYITRENPNDIYVKNGSIIRFKHSKTNDAIDKERSLVALKVGNQTINDIPALIFEGNNTSKAFSFRMPELPTVIEGTLVELSVTLYDIGGSGKQAKLVTSFIYDNDVPDFNNFTFTGINNSIPIDMDTLEAPWIDKSELTFFMFEVEDLALDIEGCKLFAEVDGSKRELEMYRFITSGSVTTLIYNLSNEDVEANFNISGDVKIHSLEVKDKVGNRIVYNSDNNTNFPQVEYVYENNFTLDTDNIKYYKRDSDVEINDNLEGPITIRIPYVSNGLSDVEVEFQETKKSMIIPYDSMRFDPENQYLEFDIAVSNEFFESDRALSYAIRMVNSSMVEKKVASVKGPKMKFTTPSEITVDFPDLKQNKWLIEHTDEEELKVVIKGRGESVDDEPVLNANKISVVLDNRVIYEVTENLISKKSYTLYLPARVLPKDTNTGKVKLGQKELFFRLSNDVGSNDGAGRSVTLSDIPDILINRGWLYYHRTGDTFTIKTNLDQNSEVEQINYTPINTPLMSPSDLWKFYGEGTTNDDIDVRITAQALDVNTALSTDEVSVRITNTDIVTNLDESYCSNNNSDNVITIDSKYSDRTEDIHLELYRVNLGNLEKIDASGFMEIDSVNYQFDPKVIHQDKEKRTESFRVKLVYHGSTGTSNIMLGYKDFQTIFEPDVTADLLMLQPVIGESSVLSIVLTDFKDRTYKLLENEHLDIINDVIESSNGEFLVRLKDSFTGKYLNLELEVYSENGRCEIYRSFKVEVSQKHVSLSEDDEIHIAFSNLEDWSKSYLTQNGETHVYEDDFEVVTPWHATSNQWKLSGNQDKGHTALTSPVYDLSFLKNDDSEFRPMLKFLYNDQTVERNGVFLQLRQLEKGAAEPWVTVGKDNEVWNWYNTYSLYNNDLNSNEKSYAWSGGSGQLEGRLPLDEYLVSSKTLDKVQFRLVFAYGENTTDAFQPISLDIQNRKRNVIIESFIQANNADHHSIEDQIQELLSIHTTADQGYMHNYYLERKLGCSDSLYDRGAEKVEARRLWYGLNSTNETDALYSLAIDGKLFEGNNSQYFDDKISDAIRRSVLKDEPVDLDWKIEDNKLIVDYAIKDTLMNKFDELLWMFTFGDEQSQIGQCNPMNLTVNNNNQVIGAIVTKKAEGQGTVVADLREITFEMGKNFKLQLLLQHLGTMEIFSATQIPIKRDIISSISPSQKVDMKLYPNPVRDVLNITYQPTPTTTYVIHNVEGQKVATGNCNGTVIKVRSLPHGMYLLSLFENGERIVVKTFIKE
ncbi:hypothetical protein AVL50_17565 [Flammeovirga sp. SJP92]|nr:hypothetical protein AVL50_17565 [Flammeovirga sp. SJP92]